MHKYWFVHNPLSDHASKARHGSYNSAIDEATKLARANPGTIFFVLESVSAFATEAPRVTEIALEAAPNVDV